MKSQLSLYIVTNAKLKLFIFLNAFRISNFILPLNSTFNLFWKSRAFYEYRISIIDMKFPGVGGGDVWEIGQINQDLPATVLIFTTEDVRVT